MTFGNHSRKAAATAPLRSPDQLRKIFIKLRIATSAAWGLGPPPCPAPPALVDGAPSAAGRKSCSGKLRSDRVPLGNNSSGELHCGSEVAWDRPRVTCIFR